MNKQSYKWAYIIPVLMSFFVMSFIDLVGTGVDELRKDSNTPSYILQLIPFVAFIWFFLLSVPVGIWQDKVGKKKALNTGILITAVGLLVPILGNTLPVILVAFALLGIGNTILQVSANPLLVDIVPAGKSSSILSFSQFVKSLGSVIGPFVAAVIGPWLAKLLGNTSGGEWRYGLYLFALISIISFIWLSAVKIPEKESSAEKASLKSCFSLLGNRYVLLMVLGIFAVVGIDVGINSNIGTFLTEKLGVSMETAVYGKSVYFFAKMAGTFIGAMLLTKIASRKFLIGSSILAAAAMVVLAITPNTVAAWVIIAVISLGVSNIFPLIFSITVEKYPTRANEISGLMMMAISGGAIIPFLIGYAMKMNINGGVVVLFACIIYILLIALFLKEKRAS
ncbi:MAG: MFS transporter [Marinilabiliales bacterium]|nr:MAG: MFS transporter [Marinilabiliales bacterium]